MGQAAHARASVARPSFAPYLPAGHVPLQLDWPDCSWNVPAAQSSQASSPVLEQEGSSLYRPGWHAAQTLGLTCDAMVLLLMEAMGQQSDEMFARHANME